MPPSSPSAAIVLIGNELLSGRTQDTNLRYLAEKLGERGITVVEARIVADAEPAIIEAVNTLRQRVTYLFTSGGIGPTHDDITAAAIAKAFGKVLFKNPTAFNMLAEHYGTRDLNEARTKMAYVPQDALLVPNPISGAPGFALENIFVLAGVPAIFQSMVDYIVVNLRGGRVVYSETVRVASSGEGDIAAWLGEVQRMHPEVSIGSYPRFNPNGEREVSLVVRSPDKEAIRKAVAAIFDKLGESPGANEGFVW